MFRSSAAVLTKTRRNVSGFAYFLRRTKTHPQLHGLDFDKRREAVVALWNGLSAEEKDTVKQAAKKYGVMVDLPRANSCGESEYHKFVKKNIKQFKGLNSRMQLQLVAQEWKRQKGIEKAAQQT